MMRCPCCFNRDRKSSIRVLSTAWPANALTVDDVDTFVLEWHRCPSMHPCTQSGTTTAVPRNAARVHPRARGLPDDEDSRRRTRLQHGARAERQVRFAGAAGTHVREQFDHRSTGFMACHEDRLKNLHATGPTPRRSRMARPMRSKGPDGVARWSRTGQASSSCVTQSGPEAPQYVLRRRANAQTPRGIRNTVLTRSDRCIARWQAEEDGASHERNPS